VEEEASTVGSEGNDCWGAQLAPLLDGEVDDALPVVPARTALSSLPPSFVGGFEFVLEIPGAAAAVGVGDGVDVCFCCSESIVSIRS
jgi:hypothetical protein